MPEETTSFREEFRKARPFLPLIVPIALFLTCWGFQGIGRVPPAMDRLGVHIIAGIAAGLLCSSVWSWLLFGGVLWLAHFCYATLAWLMWGGDHRGIIGAYIDNTFVRFHDHVLLLACFGTAGLA